MSAGKYRQRWRRNQRGGNASDLPGFRLIGLYAGHLLTSGALLLITLLLNGLLAILIQYLSQWIEDPLFHIFAWLMHIALLVCDGILLMCWLIYWLVRGLKELL